MSRVRGDPASHSRIAAHGFASLEIEVLYPWQEFVVDLGLGQGCQGLAQSALPQLAGWMPSTLNG